MSAALAGYRRNGGFSGLFAGSVMLVGLTGICLLVVYRTPSPSITSFLALVGFVVIGGWMFLSERYEFTLAALLLYLLLLDGFLKLKTGSQFATLGRDILFYAIVSGALVRWAQRRQSIQLPPLSSWVLAFTLIVLVSMFNPGSYPAVHALASVRPHLEFVPLFFFGHHVMRDPKRLRVFLVLLLLGGAVNGAVSAVQYTLEPAQLAAWGPGYRTFVEGEANGVSGRVFSTEAGEARVRPFGLGADAGGGGIIAMLAVPAAIALMSMGWRRIWYAIIAAGLSIGVLTAIITSQGRSVLLSAIAAVFAYALLSVSAKRLIPTLAGLAVGAAVLALVVSAVQSSVGDDALERYGSITPSKVLSTTSESRGGAIAVVPDYMRRFPFGHGLGTGGPATGFGKSAEQLEASAGLSAESAFSFTVLEIGIAGLIVVVGFVCRLLFLGVRGVRRIADPELRTLLSAVVAPMFGISALFVGGAPLVSSPLGPYFWFVAGVMAFWLISYRRSAFASATWAAPSWSSSMALAPAARAAASGARMPTDWSSREDWDRPPARAQQARRESSSWDALPQRQNDATGDDADR